jgi:hypothetical protein
MGQKKEGTRLLSGTSLFILRTQAKARLRRRQCGLEKPCGHTHAFCWPMTDLLDGNAIEKPTYSRICAIKFSQRPIIVAGPTANAPYGIANAAPNCGTQTVNNIPPARHLDKPALIACLKQMPGKFSMAALQNEWHDVMIAAGWKSEHKEIPVNNLRRRWRHLDWHSGEGSRCRPKSELRSPRRRYY